MLKEGFKPLRPFLWTALNGSAPKLYLSPKTHSVHQLNACSTAQAAKHFKQKSVNKSDALRRKQPDSTCPYIPFSACVAKEFKAHATGFATLSLKGKCFAAYYEVFVMKLTEEIKKRFTFSLQSRPPVQPVACSTPKRGYYRLSP